MMTSISNAGGHSNTRVKKVQEVQKFKKLIDVVVFIVSAIEYE